MSEYKADAPADGDPTRKKWSIADFPIAVRDRASSFADRKRMSVAELVAPAITDWIDRAEGNPPADPPKQPAQNPQADRLAQLERMAAIAVQISVAAHKPANKSATAALNRALTAMAHELPGGSAPPSKRITSGPATGRIAGGSNGASSGSKADEKPGADKRIASPPNDLRCIEAA